MIFANRKAKTPPISRAQESRPQPSIRTAGLADLDRVQTSRHFAVTAAAHRNAPDYADASEHSPLPFVIAWRSTLFPLQGTGDRNLPFGRIEPFWPPTIRGKARLPACSFGPQSSLTDV